MDLLQQILGRRALCDDVEARFDEEADDSLAQQPYVVGDDYTHGISARTVVPFAAGLDTEVAVQRLDAIAQTTQARATLRVGAADAVVGDLHDQLPVRARDLDAGAGRVRVLVDVRYRLADQVIRGDLDRRWERPLDGDRKLHRQRRPVRDRLERHPEAV